MKAVVIHSGGMDSSLCLAQAIAEYGHEEVLSLSFSYGQRHSTELQAAEQICADWQVAHTVIALDCLNQLTHNALTDPSLPIQVKAGVPNTLVVGRNGLMARLGAIHADSLGVDCIYMGVIEVESANSGYRDCTRSYMDQMESILQIDLGNPEFKIHTPLVYMTKAETVAFGHKLGVLDYLLKNTVTCYQGLRGRGCGVCSACQLRNAGVDAFFKSISF
jgi:7-cyano-7-deazaguanine synthase